MGNLAMVYLLIKQTKTDIRFDMELGNKAHTKTLTNGQQLTTYLQELERKPEVLETRLPTKSKYK